MSHEVGRALGEESPEGMKDNRDFADKLKCPICGQEFEQDSKIPEDQPGDKTAHLKYLEHFGESHSEKSFINNQAVPVESETVEEVTATV